MILSRDLSVPWQSRSMQDVLQALFLAELVSPSPRLWLLSGWVSDIDMVDNRARAFAGIRPDWPSTKIRFSSVIETLVMRGGTVAIVLREVKHNEPFLDRLKEIQRLAPHKLGIVVEEVAHEKSIVGEDFVFGGSMNLTNSGTTSNDEHMLLRVDPAAAARRRFALQQRWEEELQWA
jgi:hypothetical protein